MIRLTTSLSLSTEDTDDLQRRQMAVTSCGDYAAQVALADKHWAGKPSALFKRVRKALAQVCPGAQRCCYCEDSCADEIEHIRPKNWFPDQVFDPENYLFACGPCNSPKGNAYAIVDARGQLIEAKRGKGVAVCAPPAGQEALLHPRLDDPAEYFFLDLENTFLFKPRRVLDSVRRKRAEYTLDVLRLNKDVLTEGRREAFGDFLGRLESYGRAFRKGASADQLQRRRQEVLKKQHITVWREMQRQAHTPLLKPLFALVPGAEKW